MERNFEGALYFYFLLESVEDFSRNSLIYFQKNQRSVLEKVHGGSAKGICKFIEEICVEIWST